VTPRDRLFAFAQRLAAARRLHALDTRHLYATVERDATGEWCAVAHLTGSIVHTDAGTMTVDGDAGVYAHGPTADAPRCAGCGDRLATCRGSYEGAPESYACDGCCGHGNEDGHCDPVEHAAAVRAAVAR